MSDLSHGEQLSDALLFSIASALSLARFRANEKKRKTD